MEGLNGEVAPKPVSVDLRNGLKELDPPDIVRVQGKQLAADSWEKILEQTQADGYERGVVVFEKGKEVKTSRIFSGRKTEDNPGTISAPFLVHGIRRPLLARPKDFVFVHSHHVLPELDHLSSTTISAEDINSFAMRSYNALVMVERGGVHLLAKRETYVNRDVDGKRIYHEAFDYAKKRENSPSSVREGMAVKLRANGYYYFFTPNLKPFPDGFVDLQFCAPKNPK